MNQAALKKTRIVRELSYIPENQLDNVRKYIDSIVHETRQKTQTNRSLKGIWRDKGFEQIRDLESEIKAARKFFTNTVLSRQF